jgi:hypothetical protein
MTLPPEDPGVRNGVGGHCSLMGDACCPLECNPPGDAFANTDRTKELLSSNASGAGAGLFFSGVLGGCATLLEDRKSASGSARNSFAALAGSGGRPTGTDGLLE